MVGSSWLEIDLTRLGENVATFRAVLGWGSGARRRKLCAVIKADGYGLGARRIGQHLAKVGVDMVAVYSLGQAVDLVDAGLTTPILVLAPMREMGSV